jgi:PAS domain S-box-containing protein
MKSHFGRIADQLPGLIWTALPDGQAEFANTRWCEYTGLTPKDAGGRGWHRSIHPDDLAGLLERWDAMMRSGEEGEVEARLRRFDGEYRWFLFRAHPILDRSKRIARWSVGNTDIDDRKRVEALLAGEKSLLEMVARGCSLREGLEALCKLVEAMAVGALCSVLSVDPDGRRFRCGAGPSLPDAYNALLDGLLVDRNYGPCGMAVSLKTEVIAADVALDARWQASPWPSLALGYGLRSCWSAPILSRDDRVIGVFALYKATPASPTPIEQDLTRRFAHIASIAIERAQHDASLRDSEALKSAILDSALDCIVTVDHEMRVTEFNPAAEHVFGYRRQDVVGKPLAEVIIPPSLREQHRRGYARYRATGVSTMLGRRIELTAMRADGGEFPVELAIARNPLAGLPSFAAYLRDITDRRRSEDRIRSADATLSEVRSELARITRITSLSALTASIAHEVNQPLSGILTNAGACQRLLAADPPNILGARETARRMVRDGERAAEVIKRLRALFTSKEPKNELVNLSDAAQEVIALSWSDLQRSGVVVRTELADDLPTIAGDRIQLQQVVLNLLLNAVEAMKSVEDRSREVLIRTEEEEGRNVRLVVQDAGVGLDAGAAERLFEAFYTTKSDGMGIGLSVSRSIIENHGGRLWATPNDGPGVTFAFSVPRTVTAAGGVAMSEDRRPR